MAGHFRATATGARPCRCAGAFAPSNDREICLWARNAAGGLAGAVASGRPVAMLYRDTPSRTTMTIEAIGRIVQDANERETIFQMIPEVEQTHASNGR